jgi:hypothetical protein
MFGGAHESFCIFNNMRVGSPDRGGETVADRLPARSLLVPGKIVVENSRQMEVVLCGPLWKKYRSRLDD